MTSIIPGIAHSWQAREVVRELDRRPHLLVSLELTGEYFPERAAEPFVRIVPDRGRGQQCWFSEISDDQHTLRAYFPPDVKAAGTIEFGYGAKVYGQLKAPFNPERVERLDPARLPKDIVRRRSAEP